jgi:hypothetical protein
MTVDSLSFFEIFNNFNIVSNTVRIFVKSESKTSHELMIKNKINQVLFLIRK